MNTFGQQFRVTTFGESHGIAVGCVVDGCPAGLELSLEAMSADLRRRTVGDPIAGINDLPLTTPRHEEDQIETLSGLLDDKTIGTPLTFVVRNRNARSQDYASLQNYFRPGHADYTYASRFGIYDWRGGGRASARETVARVMAGSVAKQLLALHGIQLKASVVAIGGLVLKNSTQKELRELLTAVIEQGDTVGGVVQCTATNVPAGWGAPVFAKLSSQLAAAMMSIPSASAFGIGSRIEAARLTGSQYTDPWDTSGNARTLSNHCGGIQGGISNGMPVEFEVSFHPVCTRKGTMVCLNGERWETEAVTVGGRHDVCQVVRTPVIVEAMAAIVLADAMLQSKNASLQ